MRKLLLASIALLPAVSEASTWSLDLALGFPDAPALGLGFALLPNRLHLFAQTANPLLLQIKSQVPVKTLKRTETLAIQNDAQPILFDSSIADILCAGFEWFPWQGSWFMQGAYEQRQLRIRSRLRLGFQLSTANDERLSRSEVDAAISTQSEQDLLRLALGQHFDLFSSWRVGWYLGFTEVLRAHSRVQTKVELFNGEATLAREARADNLDDALQAQAEILRSLATRELRTIAAQRLPLLGISFGVAL